MKSIELTEEHKAKLLEMCKVLFPEYKYLIFGDSQGQMLFTKTKPFRECGEDNGELDKECIQMHWFEFVMTHLLSKIDRLHSEKIIRPLELKYIQEGYPKNWLEIWKERPFLKLWSLLNAGSYKKHPIDYLYCEFLKLSK